MHCLEAQAKPKKDVAKKEAKAEALKAVLGQMLSC